MIFNASKIAIALEAQGIENTQGFYRRISNFLMGGNANLTIIEKKALKKLLREETQKLTQIL